MSDAAQETAPPSPAPAPQTYGDKLSQLQGAGFSGAEIGQWQANTGGKLLAAGFNQDEVNNYLGVKTPDMSGVHKMATDNMQSGQGETQEGGQQPPKTFQDVLHQALGVPVTTPMGPADGPLPANLRTHLADAYREGTADNAGDFMSSVVPYVSGLTNNFLLSLTTSLKTGPELAYARATGNTSLAQSMISDVNAANFAREEGNPKINNFAGRAAYGAASAVVNAVPALAALATTGPFGAGAMFAGQAASEEYGQASAKGATPTGAAASAAVSGVVNFLPMGVFSKILGKTGLTQFLFHSAELAGANVSAAEISSATDKAIAEPNKTWSEWAKEQPEAVATSALTALTFSVGGHTMKMGAEPNPGVEQLKNVVAEKVGKDPSVVTHDDISNLIRMNFEHSAPMREHFNTTAQFMFGADGAKQGVETLLKVYEETGVPPTKVQMDASVHPEIMEELKQGEVPAAYEHLKEQTFYHKTDSDFLEKGLPFDPTKGFSPGAWFSENPEDSEKFNVKSEGAKTIPVNLDIKNPGTLVDLAQARREVSAEGLSQLAPTNEDFNRRVIENLEAKGFDGVRDSNSGGAGGRRIAIAFRPEQIRSAITKKPFNLENSTDDREADVKYTPFENSVDNSKELAAKPQALLAKGFTSGLEKPDDATLTPEHKDLETSLGVPETMSISQLGKANAKIERAFTSPEAQNYTDEQFKALEDYGRRVEQAHEAILKRFGGQLGMIDFRKGDSEDPESLAYGAHIAAMIPEAVKDNFNDAKRDFLLKTVPMEEGSSRAKASAKDFANRQRWSQWNASRIFHELTERLVPEELTKMWDVMDQASVHAQTLEANGTSRPEAMRQTEDDIINKQLNPEQQDILKNLSRWAQSSWDQAKKLGMVKGEGLPFWTPRMAAVIGDDGKWGAPGLGEGRPEINPVGRNLKTSSGNLKQRKYLTAEETEAAMKEHFGNEEGEGAQLVRDIRTMPLALARLNQAIAGRALVNEIKSFSADAVSDHPEEGFFTLDHPALKTFEPKLEQNEDGKWQVVKDADGNEQFKQVPIYISKEFEGPLKAVLSNDSGAIYKGLMALKGKAMSMIMYSPLIHNAVEWGRALPAMPGKVVTFKVYFEGNKAKNDPVQMKEAIDAGLVPIGSRYFNQDISSIMESPDLTPGRSWTAKLLGGLTGRVNEKAGTEVKRAIDNLGDFWHNTLLWDRVGDLQMGLYTNLRDSGIKNGLDPQAAQANAAHLANRFAGALPMESMSNNARKIANVAMFSRSFTIGNLGVMKDMFKGLPSDVYSQLERDVGKEGAAKASKAVQRKAIAAFAMDVALMYSANSLLQDTLDHLMRGKSLSQIEQGYVKRFQHLMQLHSDSPWELLNLPADMQALSSTAANEPGKENRIHFSDDPKTGTAYYMRMPTGKIGEEFMGWVTSPLDMMRKKTSTIVQPLADIYKNEDYFGHPVYDANARGFSGSVENVGKVVTHLMSAQIPEESIMASYHALTGAPGKDLNEMKVLGPLAGITFSKGYPGGPEAGILAATSRRHEAEISGALPQVKAAVEAGDTDKANEIMDKLNMTPREKHGLIQHYKNPQGKVNSRSLSKFGKIATPEEQDLMRQQQEEEQQGTSP